MSHLAVPLRESLQLDRRQASTDETSSVALDPLMSEVPVDDEDISVPNGNFDEALEHLSDSSISDADDNNIDGEVDIEEDLRNCFSV